MNDIINFAYYSLVNVAQLIILFLLISAYWNTGLVSMEFSPIGSTLKKPGMSNKVLWGFFWPILLLLIIALIFALSIVLMVGFMIFIFYKIAEDIFMTVINNKKYITSGINIRTIFSGEALSSFMNIVQNL